METLFFTIVALFFLGIAVYYVFQRSKQGSFLSKKKQKPEKILPVSAEAFDSFKNDFIQLEIYK